MSKKTRDFYHIQDQLDLAWCCVSTSALSDSQDLEYLSERISLILYDLPQMAPDVTELLELQDQKIQLLERALKKISTASQIPGDINKLIKDRVEVSLSSSGMGFFSKTHAEEDSDIRVVIALDTIGMDLTIDASVLECRLSADSENPGFWVRVRFSRGQDKQVDHLLAHVTQRQIERLQRSNNGSRLGDKNKDLS